MFGYIKVPQTRSFVGCLIIFLALQVCVYATRRESNVKRAPSGAVKAFTKGQTPQPAHPPKKLKIYGVELRRPEDNTYDSACARNLRKAGHRPFGYTKKEVLVNSILEFLKNELKRIKKKSPDPTKDVCIQELNLYGHGWRGFFALGNGQSHEFRPSTFISAESYNYQNDWKKVFAPLVGQFCQGAEVHLFGCWVGSEQQGADLLFDLANFLNVKVTAPVEEYYSRYINQVPYSGKWQVATPGNKPAPIKPKYPPPQTDASTRRPQQ